MAAKGSVMRGFDISSVVSLNKLLNKQSSDLQNYDAYVASL